MDLQFERMLQGTSPMLALAPMQDVTDLPFWRVLTRYDGADLYYTEYFRVYPGSVPDKNIARSILENPTGRPVVAQMIGNDPVELVRTARLLQEYPVAAVDLNLGCPAPVVYRKCAGGGLLRDLDRVDAILGALRDAVKGRFTVKTRLGFETPKIFPELLKLLRKHGPDLVAVHTRTVADGYRSPARHSYVLDAVSALECPVLANGDINSAAQAAAVLNDHRAAGVMVGRGAVRNPWLFHQIRQHLVGEPVFVPRGKEVLEYIHLLWESVTDSSAPDRSRVQRIKKHLNFVAAGVSPDFLRRVQRANSSEELLFLCGEFLDHDHPMPLEPLQDQATTSPRAAEVPTAQCRRPGITAG